MTVQLRFLLAVALAVATPRAQQTFQFARSGKPYLPAAHVTDWGTTCAAGDVNGDRFPDLFVGRGPERVNRLYLGTAWGALEEAPSAALPANGETTGASVLADLDGDGDLDLVTGNQPRFDVGLGRWTAQNRLYLGDGKGRFTDVTATHLPARDSWTNAIVAADVDGDGDLDLIVANEPWANYRPRIRFSGVDRLYLNDGKAKFTDATATHMPSVEHRTLDIRLGDVDRDGDLDIVGVHLDQVVPAVQNVLLFRNDGKGKFTDDSRLVQYSLPHSESVASLELFDADGDRNLDLFVTSVRTVRTSSGYKNETNRLLLGDGRGNFKDAPGRAAAMPAERTLGDVTAIDVDRDSDLDLVIAALPQNALLVNDGKGSFQCAPYSRLPGEWTETLGAGAAVIGMATSDFDRDGVSDVAIVHPYGRKLYFGDAVGGFVEVSRESLAVTAIDPVADDFDGDGDVDVIVGDAKYNGRQLRFYRNDGKTSFVEDTEARIPDLNQPWEKKGTATHLAIGDVDGDGDTDLVALINYAANPANENPLRLFENDGKGKFTAAPDTALPRPKSAIYAFALGDVDGDGDLDFAAGTLGVLPDRCVLYLNDGKGRFSDVTASHMPAAPAQTRALVFVDVDRDRDLDLVLANVPLGTSGQNQLLLNDGKGRFQDASSRLPAVKDATADVLATDFDGDGNMDLLFAGTLTTPQNRLLLGDGKGGFREVTTTNLPSWPYESLVAAAGDLDGDGDSDLVVANDTRSVLLTNDGKAKFALSPALPSTGANTGLVIGDFDSDGDNDVLAGRTRNYTISGSVGPRSVLLLNLDRQVQAPRQPKVGRVYPIDVHYKPGYATGFASLLPFFALKELQVQVPGLGLLGLDPAVMIVGQPVPFLVPGGKQTVPLPLPNFAGLYGLPLVTQFLSFESRPRPSTRLTNALRDVIR